MKQQIKQPKQATPKAEEMDMESLKALPKDFWFRKMVIQYEEKIAYILLGYVEDAVFSKDKVCKGLRTLEAWLKAHKDKGYKAKRDKMFAEFKKAMKELKADCWHYEFHLWTRTNWFDRTEFLKWSYKFGYELCSEWFALLSDIADKKGYHSEETTSIRV